MSKEPESVAWVLPDPNDPTAVRYSVLDTGADGQFHTLRPHWQPIDTAPKDGTWILTYSADDGQNVSCWRNDLEDFVPNGWDGVCDTITATHWTPLPDPPAS